MLRITVFLFGAVEVDWNKRVEDVFDHYERSISSYLDEQAIVDEKIKNRMLNDNIIKISGVSIDKIEIGEGE